MAAIRDQVSDHTSDLLHDLGRRLDSVWRYDQYIANSDGQHDLQRFWREVKAQEKQIIDHLKKLVTQQVQNGCF